MRRRLRISFFCGTAELVVRRGRRLALLGVVTVQCHLPYFRHNFLRVLIVPYKSENARATTREHHHFHRIFFPSYSDYSARLAYGARAGRLGLSLIHI